MAATTTICLEPEVKGLLDFLKINKDETYNSVVKRLCNRAIDHEPLSNESLRKIEEGLKDIKEGRYYTLEEVEAELDAERSKECTV